MSAVILALIIQVIGIVQAHALVPLHITTTDPLSPGAVGAGYSASFSAAGGKSPYAWSLVPSNKVPPGLGLSPGGALTGTPTTSGQFAVCYRHGFGLSYAEVPVRTPPIQVPLAGQPVSFAIAGAGGSSFIAVAESVRQGLAARLTSRMELVELRGGIARSTTTLAEFPAQISGVTMASSAQGRLALVWSDDRYSVPQLVNSEIFGRVREPDGRWLPERQLSHTLDESLAPAVIFEAEEPHIVWQDRGFGAFEIVHRRMDQETGLDVVSRRDGQRSVTPQLTIAEGLMTVVWRDAIYGRADIFLSTELPEGASGHD